MLYDAEYFVLDNIDEDITQEMIKAAEAITCYLNTYYWKSKDLRLEEWDPNNDAIFELVLRVFTLALSTHRNTMQCYLGMLAHNFPHDSTLDRVKTAGEVLAVIAIHSDLITIDKGETGNYIMVDTQYELADMPVLTKHNIIYETIPQNHGNRSEDHGSLILGNHINHHDEDICIEHLDRMNAVPLQLNTALLDAYQEKPKLSLAEKDALMPAYVRECFNENPEQYKRIYAEHWETYKQKIQWEKFVEESAAKYAEVIDRGNLFYLHHKYDKRGRTYAQGYHIDTQGASFKKAIVQLANTECIAITRSTKKAEPMKEVTVVNRYKDTFTDYIGKGTVFGNSLATVGMTVKQRDAACDGYHKYFHGAMTGQAATPGEVRLRKAVSVLINRVRAGEQVILGCFCKPKRCHGDIIADYINKHVSDSAIIDAAQLFDALIPTEDSVYAQRVTPIQPIKVIIAGSRSITDMEHVEDAMTASGFDIIEVVSGTAKGVDILGECCAANSDIAVKRFPAEWKDLEATGAVIKQGAYGPYNALAGMHRNQRMGEYADALIAVWDGKSTGTKHMIDYMKKCNKPVYVHNINE